MISSHKFISNEAVKKHIFVDEVGEKDGRAVYSCFLVSRVQSDMIEILNAEILPLFDEHLGHKPIFKIDEIKVFSMNKIFHNYFLNSNIENGRIKDSFSDSHLFITD